MRKLRLFILVLILSMLLSGCQFFLPFFYLNVSRQEEPPEQTQPQTLPIGEDIPPHLDAEDIYYRAKFAVDDRAYQYAESTTFDLLCQDEDLQYPMQLSYERQVVLSPEDCAVNVTTEITVDSFQDEPHIYQEYYRDEEGRLIYYAADSFTNEYIREEIPLEEYTPYAVIYDFTLTGCPYYPDEITLEPQTKILDGREVYVLTYPQPALYAFGSTGNAVTDEALFFRTIPTTWYVDTETYLPVKQEFVLIQVDDLLWQVINGRYGLTDPEIIVTLEKLSWSYVYNSYDPVDVPEIPEETLRKAWENAGGSIT